MLSKDLVSKLRKIFGDRIDDREGELKCHSLDSAGYTGYTYLVVYPECEEEVSELVKLCYKYNVPIYPQGGLSSLTGAAVPYGGIVVDMSMMDKILEISTEDMIVVVEPGIKLVDLNRILRKKGLYFPVDPASQKVATIGGMIGTGAGGMRCIKYGVMRDWVYGLRVVIRDGIVLDIGAKTHKCRDGYDLVRLFIGSEGTLGIVTQATLRITNYPRSRTRILVNIQDLQLLGDVLKIARSGDWDISLLETIFEESTDILRRVFDDVLKPGINVIIDVDGKSSRESAEELAQHLTSIGCDAQVLNDEMAEKVLEVRRKLASIIIKEGKLGSMGEDVTVPPSKIPLLIKYAKEASKKYGLEVYFYGHAGDGNIHVRVQINEEAERKKIEAYIKEVIKYAISLGGVVSGEHGIGNAKIDLLKYEFEVRGSPYVIELFKGIKQLFDPKNIFNPGKIFRAD